MKTFPAFDEAGGGLSPRWPKKGRPLSGQRAPKIPWPSFFALLTVDKRQTHDVRNGQVA
jgi:hypothetical protein